MAVKRESDMVFDSEPFFYQIFDDFSIVFNMIFDDVFDQRMM